MEALVLPPCALGGTLDQKKDAREIGTKYGLQSVMIITNQSSIRCGCERKSIGCMGSLCSGFQTLL